MNPQQNGQDTRPAKSLPRVRVPTVQEALPFTPFASIVPFNPELIPTPHFANYLPDGGIRSEEALQSSRETLAKLSNGVSRAEDASQRCQQTLQDVQKLLNSGHLTQFTMRPAVPRHSASTKNAEPMSNIAVNGFAKMVLDNTKINFKIAKPDAAPAHKIAQQDVTRPPTSKVQSKQIKPFIIQDQNNAPAPVVPLQTGPIAYPQATVADPRLMPAPQHQTNVTATPHAEGDKNVRLLNAMLRDLFAAEQLHDNGNILDEQLAAIVSSYDSSEGSVAVLTHACLVRTDNAILKVIKTSSLGRLNVDDLKHLQRICERSLTAVAYTSLQVEDSWSEVEVEEWQRKITMAECALYATRILLRIMTALSSERELQSEEVLKSMLQVLKNVAETGIVWFVEERASSDRPDSRFAIAAESKDELLQILRSFGKILQLLSSLLAKVHVDETAISSIVYMCKIMIFAENATSEKDSILGIQNFESCRKYALSVLARIFSKYPDQRQYIFDEILTSLEKLPATKQNARQYRLPDHKPIQLVSALIMQLIQTSATIVEIRKPSAKIVQEDDEDEDDSDDDKPLNQISQDKKISLQALIEPADKATQTNAMYFSRLLTQRALNLSKNADEPYRKLLDIFIDDFLNVLGSSDWPSAELLLRSQLRQLIAIVEDRKSTSPVKNFAIELLGKLAAGILDIQGQAQSAAKTSSAEGSDLSMSLRGLLDQGMTGQVPPDDLLALSGPYRAVIEFLRSNTTTDTQSRTAGDYYLLQWAQQTLQWQQLEKDDDDSDAQPQQLTEAIRTMIQDQQWLELNIALPHITANESKLASLILMLNSPFCKAFAAILNRLFQSLTSEHATVKSRGLKSIVMLIETDPSVIERYPMVLNGIFACGQDPSALVRDSALGILSKCMTLRPSMDVEIYERIMLRAQDQAIGVRKRAMKMLKDIYLRNDSRQIRANISAALITRMSDNEEGVVELARQIVEDIWFQPLFAEARPNDALQTKLALQALASLLVQTADVANTNAQSLLPLLQDLLTKSKQAKDNRSIAKKLIDVLFDGLIDTSSLPGSPPQIMILRLLSVFAQSSPKLFDAAQLELLAPYTKNLKTDEDLNIFRLALTVLRHTMPYVKSLKHTMLSTLQADLMTTVGKLPKHTLSEVASCLWTIDGELKNTGKLVHMETTALSMIRKSAATYHDDEGRRVVRFIDLAGQFGRACDFEPHISVFKQKVPDVKSSTAAGIAVDVFLTFTGSEVPTNVREAALDAICAVSQRWPKQFLRKEVMANFDLLLREHIPQLEAVFVEALLEFFSAQETSVSSDDPEKGVTGRERLARTYVASDQDGATSALSQRYLSHITRLALASTDELALSATKLMTSIVRQGLPHPKECGPSLIALETSPNTAIATLASVEHKTLHEKHETIIEKEYMRAMELALSYQKTVVGDIRGYTGQPPTAKLRFFWEVLRSGKAKVKQKYLVNICSKFGFDYNTLDVAGETSQHLAFVRFMVENLALLDYDRADDLRLLIENLGKAFATTGTAVAQAIESEVFSVTVESIGMSQPQIHGYEAISSQPAAIDPARLHRLAVSAQIMLLISETRAVLLRIWGGQKLLKKEKAKESSKAPTRVSNAGLVIDIFIKKIDDLAASLLDQESQLSRCRAFTEAVNIDNDAKVTSGDDEDEALIDDEQDIEVGTPGGRKRKLSSSSLGGPSRKKRASFERKGSNVSRTTTDDDDDDADGEFI